MIESIKVIIVFISIFGIVEWLLSTLYCVFVDPKSKQMKEFAQIALFTTTILAIVVIVSKSTEISKLTESDNNTGILAIIFSAIFSVALSTIMTYVILAEHKAIILSKRIMNKIEETEPDYKFVPPRKINKELSAGICDDCIHCGIIYEGNGVDEPAQSFHYCPKTEKEIIPVCDKQKGIRIIQCEYYER